MKNIILGALAIALATMTALAVTASPAFADDPPHAVSTMEVSQEYSSNVHGGDRVVPYQLIALTPDAAMPEGTVNGIYEFTLDGDDAKTIYIEHTGAGPFEYDISCVDQDVYTTVERRSIRVVVYMLGSGDDATAVALGYNYDGEKVPDLSFDVRYEYQEPEESTNEPEGSGPSPSPNENVDEPKNKNTSIPVSAPTNTQKQTPTPSQPDKGPSQTGDIVLKVIIAVAVVAVVVAVILVIKRRRDDGYIDYL